MAWKETYVMEERFKFIVEVLDEKYSVKELCEAYGISRKTGYKWLERYKIEGIEGLKDQSKAPVNPWNKLNDLIREEILNIKYTYKHWGPKKIRAKLLVNNPDWERFPAASTIGNLLEKEGLVISKKRNKKAIPTEFPLTNGLQPNDVWSADFKGYFYTSIREKCTPLTISDNYSRYLLNCRHVDRMDFVETKKEFERVFYNYGLPLVIRTDNGTPFSARNIYGLSRLSLWWIRLGIYPERIKPGHPEQNGRHERMHRTLKKTVAKPPAKNLKIQKEKLKYFRDEYNNSRPHEALNMDTPSMHYSRSTRELSNRLPNIEYSKDKIVKRVQLKGDIYYKGRRIFITECLYGENIGLEEIEEDKVKLWYCNYSLGELDSITGKIKPCKCQSINKDISWTYKI